MFDTSSDTERVTKASLRELRFDVRLRRALLNAGYQSLEQVLQTSTSQLERDLGSRHFEAVIKLKNRVLSDPEGFEKEAISDISSEKRAEIEQKLVRAREQRIEIGRQSAARKLEARSRSGSREDFVLPDEEFIDMLSELESSAREALALLADHAESAIVAECFPRLILDLDDLRSCFIDLFTHYRYSQSRAIKAACEHYPNAFLVFIAHSASEDFDGDAFWNNLYARLGVESQSVQTDIKWAFNQGIRDRGFPFFTSEDSDFHLLHTALLHGGFSETFWEPMWRDVIFPFAKSRLGSALTSRDASQLIRELKADSGKYGLNRVYAKRILEKAPTSMLEPLMEAALNVANEVMEAESGSDDSNSAFGMTSSYGLSDPAMQALRSVLENRGTKSAKRIVYLPPAELRIRPEDGTVHLHWDAQKLTQSFAGRSITYFVNGEERAVADLKMGVGKCVLDERDIALRPSERFDVELVMFDSDEQRTRLASLNQTFDRTRPGSFEFVQSSDGVFRLRKPRERIKRPKVVAFLTKAELWVVPGKGMTEIEEYNAAEDWGGASVQLFEVEPGSSGSIVNIHTREEVACWQEDYRVEVDRSHMIGKAADKRDLYGFSYERDLGTNASLPEIIIEAHDVTAIRDDLAIACVCDGKRVSLPWEAIQDEVDHDYVQSGRFVVKPREAAFIERFVRDGVIRIEQKSTGQALLNYKFAVIPVRSFGIYELYWEDDIIMATYVLEAIDPMTIPTEDGDYEMISGDKYYFDAPLGDEAINTTVRSDITGKLLDVSLYLAHVSVDVPNDIVEANKTRPICMADVENMNGRISIVSTGRRHGRYACVMMGMDPLLFKKLSGNTTYSFDIFRDPRRLALNGKPEEKNVMLAITHGEKTDSGKQVPAWADVMLVRCVTGYNLGNPRIIWRESGLSLGFEHAAPIDFEVWFYEPKKGASLGSSELAEGQATVLLPQEVAYRIDVRKTVGVTVVPISMFGEPDENMAVTFELHR